MNIAWVQPPAGLLALGNCPEATIEVRLTYNSTTRVSSYEALIYLKGHNIPHSVVENTLSAAKSRAKQRLKSIVSKMKSDHAQARYWAEQITLAPLNDEHVTKSACGYCVQYRPSYRDWVTWLPGQLEGTLRGNDEQFTKWASATYGE